MNSTRLAGLWQRHVSVFWLNVAPFIVYVLNAMLFSFNTEMVRAANGITADGLLTVSSFSGMGEILATWSSTNRFRASIAPDGRYVFEVRPIHEPGDLFYLTFDGTDTIFVRYREAIVDVNQNIIGRKPLEDNVHPAYLSSGDYPFVPWEEQKRAHILWLVFGSGKYLRDEATPSMPLPWIPARWSLLSYGFRVEDELSADPPYAPQKLQFVRDRKLDLPGALEMERTELDSPSGDSWIVKWKKELEERKLYWRDGFIAGKLESSNFTNHNGLTIPMAFSFKAFHPRWASRTGKLRWKYDGVVTNMADLAANQTFQPPIISVVSAQDSRYRFRDGKRSLGGINYAVTTTNKWPSRESSENQKQFQAGLASREVSARYVYGTVRNKRLIITGIVSCIALALPLLLYRSAKKKQREGALDES